MKSITVAYFGRKVTYCSEVPICAAYDAMKKALARQRWKREHRLNRLAAKAFPRRRAVR